MQIHSILQTFLDSHRRSLELRCSGLRVHRVDREVVRGDFIVKMYEKKNKARAQSRVKANRRKNRPAARTDAHFFSLSNAETRAVLRRKINRVRTVQRRRIALALRSSVK